MLDSKIRRTNDSCLFCSSQVPPDGDARENGGIIDIHCPHCDWKILSGIVIKETRQVVTDSHRIPQEVRDMTVDDITSLGMYEAWWTHHGVVVAIHGVVVTGDEDIYKLAEEIYTYDN